MSRLDILFPTTNFNPGKLVRNRLRIFGKQGRRYSLCSIANILRLWKTRER